MTASACTLLAGNKGLENAYARGYDSSDDSVIVRLPAYAKYFCKQKGG